MLVGIYGTSFHVGLLSIQLAYNQATLIPSPITGVQDTSSPHYTSPRGKYDIGANPIPYDFEGYHHIGHIDQYHLRDTERFTSRAIVDQEIVDVVSPLLLVAHVLGIIVNLLLGKMISLLLK